MSFAYIKLTLTGNANAIDVCRLLRSIKNHDEIVEDIDTEDKYTMISKQRVKEALNHWLKEQKGLKEAILKELGLEDLK